MSRGCLSLGVVATSLALQVSHGFQTMQQLPVASNHPCTLSSPTNIFLRASTEDLSSEIESLVVDEKSNGQLQFRANIASLSKPMPFDSEEKVVAFFKDPHYRNLFFTAGGKREWNSVETTAELLGQWTKKSLLQGITVPDETDEIFGVKTGGIQFPGLTLETSAIMGIKLIEGPKPKYEVTLIKDDRTVNGIPPAVWLFKKLTGTSENENPTISTTSIAYECSPDNSNVVFTADTSMVITVKFPNVLMKLLPTTKEKAEEQGSQSIKKVVGKDIEASMDGFEEAYLTSLN